MKFRAFILVVPNYKKAKLALQLSPVFRFRFLATAWIWKQGCPLGVSRNDNFMQIAKICEIE